MAPDGGDAVSVTVPVPQRSTLLAVGAAGPVAKIVTGTRVLVAELQDVVLAST